MQSHTITHLLQCPRQQLLGLVGEAPKHRGPPTHTSLHHPGTRTHDSHNTHNTHLLQRPRQQLLVLVGEAPKHGHALNQVELGLDCLLGVLALDAHHNRALRHPQGAGRCREHMGGGMCAF